MRGMTPNDNNNYYRCGSNNLASGAFEYALVSRNALFIVTQLVHQPIENTR